MPNQKTPQGTGQVKKMTVEELQVLITANTKDFNAKIDKANKRLGRLNSRQHARERVLESFLQA